MSRLLKIIVTGPFGAGKTQLIKTISDIPVVSTERKISQRTKGQKSQTTVAMDYGRVELGDDILHLNGTPGQARFDFMWEILSREMHGLVLVVDASHEESLAEAREMLAEFMHPRPVPYLIAANKQDRANALKPEQVRRAMNLDANAYILPCTASQKSSVQFLLRQLVAEIN
jgi:small GTP-binding protein